MKTIIQILLGLFLGIASMWWAIKNVEIANLWQYFSQVNFLDIIGLAILFMIQQLLRAHRQQLLFPQLSYRASLMVLCVGFFFINTLPARIGELSRPLLLKERENIPLSSSFAMVFTERLLDLIFAFLLALLFLAFADIPIMESNWSARIATSAQFVLPIAILSLMIGMLLGNRITEYLPHRIHQKLQPFFDTLEKQRSKIIHIVVSSTIIWGMTPLLFLLGGRSFNLDLEYVEGVGLLGFTMLGMAAPNAPGFAGTYEASFLAGLQVMGIPDQTRNFAFAFGFHWWVYIVQSISALYFFATQRISIQKTLQQLRQLRVNSKA